MRVFGLAKRRRVSHVDSADLHPVTIAAADAVTGATVVMRGVVAGDETANRHATSRPFRAAQLRQ
jgi:hypothetical protein